jgi:hypothetical protein
VEIADGKTFYEELGVYHGKQDDDYSVEVKVKKIR